MVESKSPSLDKIVQQVLLEDIQEPCLSKSESMMKTEQPYADDQSKSRVPILSREGEDSQISERLITK